VGIEDLFYLDSDNRGLVEDVGGHRTAIHASSSRSPIKRQRRHPHEEATKRSRG
jgi:hypothetical protein